MQSNNNKMNTNDNDFKLAGKRGKKVAVAVTIPVSAPIILCDHCQRPGHKIEKCFILEKLKTTNCVYCHVLGHDNKHCPVSEANAEKKRIKAEIWKEKEAKFNSDFPKVLSSLEAPIVSEKTKFAWASVAMANRDLNLVQKIEKEELVLQEVLRKQEQEKRRHENWEKKQVKLAADKQHWYKIKPVVIAMKAAFPKTWIDKVENTPYDTNQASNLRWEEERKRDEWEFEQERLEWEENERWLKEAIQKMAERDKMTAEELDEDYRQAEEEYEDSRMNEENLMYSRMFGRYSRPKSQCSSCIEWLEDGNQGSLCINCIFQLGPYPLKM
jgi:hypothetical protein